MEDSYFYKAPLRLQWIVKRLVILGLTAYATCCFYKIIAFFAHPPLPNYVFIVLFLFYAIANFKL